MPAEPAKPVEEEPDDLTHLQFPVEGAAGQSKKRQRLGKEEVEEVEDDGQGRGKRVKKLALTAREAAENEQAVKEVWAPTTNRLSLTKLLMKLMRLMSLVSLVSLMYSLAPGG